MTTIVTDNCKGCRYTDCVTVCPVACFHYDDEMLYIDPMSALTAAPAFRNVRFRRFTKKTISQKTSRSGSKSMLRKPPNFR